MPVRTRASAPANRIYSSPAAQEQVKFKPRRKLVTYRRSTGGIRPTRQSTLTQIDFVNLQHLEDDDEAIEDKEAIKRKKRRRTQENERAPTSSYQTQTLTQLDFVSTSLMVADDLYGNGDEYLYGTDYDIKPEPNTQLGNGNIWQPTVMGPPKTPRRPRNYVVPSSQSPASPVSNRRRRFLHTRSPLKNIDGNVQVVSSPAHKGSRRKLIKAEVADSEDFVEESQKDALQQTPIAKGGKCLSDQNFVSNPPKRIREEIQDSDEEEELDTWREDVERETLVETDLIKSSDSQEAEVQLQSNILQFTQLEPYSTEHISATERVECPLPRPSQATTVSLSQSQGQQLRSSPIKSSIKSEELEDISVDEQSELMIPESPPNPVMVTQSQSPSPSMVLPQLRNRIPPVTSTNISETPVPFSIASSQLLTRSQMLPESLMQDAITPPPVLIDDSDPDE